MTIEARKEVLECAECEKKHEVVVVRDSDDPEKPEFFKIPPGALLTNAPDSDDENAWFLVCSEKCAAAFLEAYDEEEEEDEDEPEETH